MAEVNIREFRERMSFYLSNLPITLTKGGVAIAEIIPIGVVYTQKESLVYTPPAEQPKPTVESLRALMN